MTRIIFMMFFLATACGGHPGENAQNQQTAGNDQTKIDAAMMAPRAVLVRADLTTEVDEKRYRPLLPPRSNFQVTESVIYLVGKLKKVPTSSVIEVRWFIDSSREPLLISNVTGSDRYQFLASFRPVEQKFVRGSYAARIYVNDREVGAVTFVIQDDAFETAGTKLSDIKFSTKIRKREKPVKPKNHFPKGIERVYGTFALKGADFNDVIEVNWFHGPDHFHTEQVNCTGDRRYAVFIDSSPHLPAGDYRIEVTLGQMMLGSKGFLIGKKTAGPAVDEIILGKRLGDDNMPEKPAKWFRKSDEIVYCGLSFVDLEPDSRLQIEWAKLKKRDLTVLETQRTIIRSGGTGSFGIAWEPQNPLEKGTYQITVLIDGETAAEKEFEVR